MITWRPRLLTSLGLAVVVLGFVYDMKFAGIPYQDPTPEMQATWLFHKRMAGNVILAGLLMLIGGGVWWAIKSVLRALQR